MNTRSIAMIAVLAVAAVAIIGAGYAYYWGQTTVEDNKVDVEYIAVETDMTKIDDGAGDAYKLDFNTTYYQSADAEGKTYGIEAADGAPAFTYNSTAGVFLSPIQSAQKFLLKAPQAFAANSYDFQVTVTGVSLGSNASIWLGVAGVVRDATAPAAAEDFFKFYPASANANGTNTYVAHPTAQALTALDTDLSLGYQSDEDYYAWIFVGEDTTDSTHAKILLADVNTAKCNINGAISFKATVEKDAAGTASKITETAFITKGGSNSITYTTSADMHGLSIAVVAYDAGIKTGDFTVTQATEEGAAKVAFTGSTVAGAHYLTVAFFVDTGGAGLDGETIVFYRTYTATYAA